MVVHWVLYDIAWVRVTESERDRDWTNGYSYVSFWAWIAMSSQIGLNDEDDKYGADMMGRTRGKTQPMSKSDVFAYNVTPSGRVSI